MTGPVVPLALEGARVRLFPGFGWWRAVQGSGQFGRNADAEMMLFDAGSALLSQDLFAGFWRDEAMDLDWLGDFVRDPAMHGMIELLHGATEADEADDGEEMYSRRDLATLGSDMRDDY
jgi:hypothetical protein